MIGRFSRKKQTNGVLHQGRKEFLKAAGLGGISLILPGLAPKQELVNPLLSQPIKIYDNYLRGIQYYDLGKCLDEIRVGDGVKLKREAGNVHDRFAVGVEWGRNFLGYLPAYENIVLANLLDSGVKLSAMVTAKHSFREVGIGVWADLIVTDPASQTGLSDRAADEVEDRYRG